MEFAAAFRSAGTVRIEMVISTGEMPLADSDQDTGDNEPGQILGKGETQEACREEQACGDQGGNGSLLVEENAEGGAGDPAMREAAVANTPILAIPSSSRAKAAIKTVIPVRVP